MSAARVFADGKWALLTALVLVSLAVFVVFVFRPGGFEAQIGWYFGLLPGAIPGAYLANHVARWVPNLERAVQWSSILVLSFLWYFVISYGVIKLCRLVLRILRA
jgi:hypothetical protein